MHPFSEKYFKRFQAYDKQIKDLPAENLQIIAVIPCSNEPDFAATLNSLYQCEFSGFSAEIITVINSSEDAPQSKKNFNRQTLQEIKKQALGFSNPNLKFHFLLHENLPKKFAGVGLARKIGMDEAVRRFASLNRPTGIITGFDADSLTDKNYFSEIFKSFSEKPKQKAASLYFEHPISGTEFSFDIYNGISAYELHLRYFNQSLRRAGFPYAYHTVGSSFAVRAETYAAQGGMNRRKAGEDFYFLQKVIPLGNYGEINMLRVIPSPRTSDRVPFGTGAALAKMQEAENFGFLTYNFAAFLDLEKLFLLVPKLYEKDDIKSLPPPLQEFLINNIFKEKLEGMRGNSTDITTFKKRFFSFFDAFKIIRFLNISHENYYKKVPVNEASLNFAQKHLPKSDLLKQLSCNQSSQNKKTKIALLAFRKIELLGNKK